MTILLLLSLLSAGCIGGDDAGPESVEPILRATGVFGDFGPARTHLADRDRPK